ncbi:hypothetical protein GGI12_005311 [Dipsacomyces acuminosporus]|nr:hypothetical protein GGI12_005311 [Dipsacomyces acuminosporus]
MLLKPSLTALLAIAAMLSLVVSALPPAPLLLSDSFTSYKFSQAQSAQAKSKKLLQIHATAHPNTTAATSTTARFQIRAVSTKPGKKPSISRHAEEKLMNDFIRYAQYSRAAYFSSSNKWDCPKCTDRNSPIHNADIHKFFSRGSHGYVGYDREAREIIVAFRGTSSPEDLRNDLKIEWMDWKAAGKGAKVHTGFYSYYKGAASAVHSAINDILKSAKAVDRIVFTGHSLGGATSSLMAADFVSKNNKLLGKVMLVTFGQPRTGNRAFASWMDKQPFAKYRITYKNDIIPRIPLESEDGYYHHGQEYYYQSYRLMKTCAAHGEDINCINRIPFDKLSLVDHSFYPGLELF